MQHDDDPGNLPDGEQNHLGTDLGNPLRDTLALVDLGHRDVGAVAVHVDHLQHPCEELAEMVYRTMTPDWAELE